jgi:hypothetical protein
MKDNQDRTNQNRREEAKFQLRLITKWNMMLKSKKATETISGKISKDITNDLKSCFSVENDDKESYSEKIPQSFTDGIKHLKEGMSEMAKY